MANICQSPSLTNQPAFVLCIKMLVSKSTCSQTAAKLRLAKQSGSIQASIQTKDCIRKSSRWEGIKVLSVVLSTSQILKLSAHSWPAPPTHLANRSTTVPSP